MFNLSVVLLGVAFFAITLSAPWKTMAYEQAFTKTPVEEIEVRTLPAARWLVTDGEGRYFEQSNSLFKRLFNYIRANDIAMTVPVEGHLERAEMRFYLGGSAPASLEGTDAVRIEEVPSRQVASIGGKGAYSESNVSRLRERLESWVQSQDAWRAAGAPYAVFWNGPFTPWFMKRFEVHLPISPAADR